MIALTSLAYSQSVKPRQPGMPRLFEVADLVLDDCAPVGDAAGECCQGYRNAWPSLDDHRGSHPEAVMVRTAANCC